jgi:putative addiction module CopG family antidote
MPMPTRNISLTPEQDAFIGEILEAGEYRNASEAVRDAIRALQQRRAEDALRLERLRRSIDAGLADLDRGDDEDVGDADLDEPGVHQPGPAERVVGARRAELAALCRRYHVRRLDLFGSAAAGTDRPGESDLDFLVEFEPVPPASYADTYFGLMEALQELFGRPVDLVVSSAVRNPYFRASVERTRTPLYGA